MATRKRKSPVPTFRGMMCMRVAKIAAYVDCGQVELAKHHAIELQKMLIERGLLVDVPARTCDNGPHSGK